eukprot:gene4727-2710_t
MMHHSFHTYLTVEYDGRLFSLLVVPFGLESAPSYCQRLARGVARVFRQHDTNCEAFYRRAPGARRRDDFLIAAATSVGDARPWPELTVRQRHPRRRNNAYNVFSSLGLALGTPKCDERPSNQPEFLGYIIYTALNRIDLTPR